MSIDIIIPRIMLKKDIMILPLLDSSVINSFNDSGTKSVIDTQTITPEANAKEEVIILSLLVFLIKINKLPIIVDNPAIIVKRKEKRVFDIEFTYLNI